MLTGLTTLVAVAMLAPVARAGEDYTGFFSQAELSRAGWSTCAPLRWSVDVTGLTPGPARAEVRRLKGAWRQWSQASGIVVVFAGRERLSFDPSTNGLRPPAGSVRQDHHVYVAFKTRAQVPIMASNAVGLAMPTMVMPATQEITAGMAIFRRGYVEKQARVSPDGVVNLYLHEIGHVLGLGHASGTDNVMHPTLGQLTRVGSGDRAGASAITQACPSP